MVVLLFICLVLIVALLPVVILRKIKESRANAQIENFYDRCRSLQIGMTKNEVIYMLGNRYRFNCNANVEYCYWTLSIPEKNTEVSCLVTFVNGYVAKVELQ